jgi:hypothetical protein
MLHVIANVVSIRFGTMENEATKETFKWAKIMTLEDDIEESNGFIGQRVVEYSVPAESVDLVVANAKHDHTIPSPCNLDFSVVMSGGKATLKCIGLKKFTPKS